MSESEFEKPEVKVMRSISFHRIFSLYETYSDDIERIDQIYPEDTHSGCDFSSCDDSGCCDQKREYHRSTISDKSKSFDIYSCHEKCHGNNDREERKKKGWIFTDKRIFIEEKELHGQSSHNDKRNKRKTPSESRNTIRKIQRIKYEYIPTYCKNKRNIVDTIHFWEKCELKKVFIETNSISKYSWNIRDFYTRDSDDEPHQYLQGKSKNWRDFDIGFSYGIEVVYKTDNTNNRGKSNDDNKFFLKCFWKTKHPWDVWRENDENEGKNNSDRVRCWSPPHFIFIEMRKIGKSIFSPEIIDDPESSPCKNSRWEKENDETYKKFHNFIFLSFSSRFFYSILLLFLERISSCFLV